MTRTAQHIRSSRAVSTCRTDNESTRKEKDMKRHAGVTTISLFLLLVTGPGLLHAASITGSEASGAAGTQDVILSFDLATGAEENVSALQFDVSYDTSRLTFSEVTAGQVALDAGKEIASSVPSAGTIRAVIYGINQNSIADGTVATMRFDIDGSASAGEVPVSITNTVASDPDAGAVTIGSVDGSVTVSASGSDTDPEEEPDETPDVSSECFINVVSTWRKSDGP